MKVYAARRRVYDRSRAAISKSQQSARGEAGALSARLQPPAEASLRGGALEDFGFTGGALEDFGFTGGAGAAARARVAAAAGLFARAIFGLAPPAGVDFYR